NYEVMDSSGGLVISGSFQPGDTLAFRGIEFNLEGQPQAADEFIVSASSFQDVFTTIERLATSIEQTVLDDTSRAEVNNGVNAGLRDLDQALGNVLDVRTQVGSRLAAIEAQVDNNGAFALTMQSTIAAIEDLDYAEAISRLSAQTQTLEAAQRSFVITQQLSLFNFL
ncbi:MAG: flagellar hook-associated protein 3, partial [Gammaproteobacteria bacterium]|nr:flagellar hook-associated protein 3 [Gammaproteobacteria bacterium]